MKPLKLIGILLIVILFPFKYTVAQTSLVLQQNGMSIPLKATANTRNDSSVDALLHQRFTFSSNRPISSIISWGQYGNCYYASVDITGNSINRIDRVVQSGHFIFFIYKDIPNTENETETSPAKEWDDMLRFVASFYERYLKIDYSIPILSLIHI